jgi:hypothetical protein
VFPLVEEADELATGVPPAGLLVVHDASGGGEDQKAEMARGEDVGNPLLELGNLHVVPAIGKWNFFFKKRERKKYVGLLRNHADVQDEREGGGWGRRGGNRNTKFIFFF